MSKTVFLSYARGEDEPFVVRERFLLVLGPKASSDYVIAEWQHAVTYGKAINPVLRLGDFPLVPDELKLLHVEDLRDDTRYALHLENLIRRLCESIAWGKRMHSHRRYRKDT